MSPERRAERNDYLQQWRKDNPEKYAAQLENNRESQRASRRAWRERNREAERMAASTRKKNDLAYRLASRYRLSLEEAHAIAATKPDRCDICHEITEPRKLHYEHCHATGKFRGWACQNCNHGLGNFKDSPELLRAAADYLERSRAQ